MKVCKVCKVEKSEFDFGKKGTKKNGDVILQSRCKTCQNAYSKLHYNKNKSKYITNVKKNNKLYRTKNCLFLIEYFKTHPCVDCGETNPIILEFDHVSGKKSYSISFMSKSAHSLDSIKKEIEKCEVRCCNCHRKVTAKRANWLILQLI